MQVPTIRQSGGIFEIYIPGLFLLIHLFAIFIYSHIEYIKGLKKTDAIFGLYSQLGILIIILICFGYLIGMILRLFHVKSVDVYSGWIHCRLHELIHYHWFINLFKSDKNKLQNPPIPDWAADKFPYVSSLNSRVNRLSKEAIQFYKDVWIPKDKEMEGNSDFFSHCKEVLFSKNDFAVHDLRSSETTMRYLSGMFYSLVFSIICLAIIFYMGEEIRAEIGILIGLYSIASGIIVYKFRYLRRKEAFLMFNTTFANKELFS